MFIFDDPRLVFVVGPLLAVAFYKVQLLLCQRVKYLQFKLIPFYLFLMLLVFSAFLYMGVFDGRSSGLANVNELVALILAISFGPSFIGVFVAWMVHWRALRRS